MRELIELRLGPGPILGVLAMLGLPCLVVARRLLKKLRRWPDLSSPSRRDLATDLAYAIVAPITETLSRTLTTLGIAVCAATLGRCVDPGLLDGFGPVARQPYWLVVLEMLVLSDFIYYWTHRCAHAVPWLWRLHAVHHSTEHLRWTSALRAHPAEVYVHLVNVLPLFLLGFPVDALVPLAPVITLYAFLIHTGADVRLRPLSYVLNTPVFHGTHHARDIRRGTKNFAGLFPVFDVVFGTYQLPEHAPRQTGIDDAHMPGTMVAQLLYPFRREATPSATPSDVRSGPLHVQAREVAP